VGPDRNYSTAFMQDFPASAATKIVRLALEEDIGSGDLTCRLVLPTAHRSRARIVAKDHGILAGRPLAELVFSELLRLDAQIGKVAVRPAKSDGDSLVPGDLVMEFEGPTRAILEGERTILNLLQHLSGVATMARRYQDAAGSTCRVLDTRKTTPGQRLLEKWAIRVGGGSNHRMGLWDAVLIKENHAQAVGGVREAARKALQAKTPDTDLIVEVRDLAELESVLDLPLTRVLLDNFTPELVAQALARRDQAKADFRIEVSGGITLETLPAYARAGAEFASVGALTHSTRPVDLSLLLEGL
jgi:nicotinate-nucleotide pyrophosphorylase (carboxylating)